MRLVSDGWKEAEQSRKEVQENFHPQEYTNALRSELGGYDECSRTPASYAMFHYFSIYLAPSIRMNKLLQSQALFVISLISLESAVEPYSRISYTVVVCYSAKALGRPAQHGARNLRIRTLDIL